MIEFIKKINCSAVLYLILFLFLPVPICCVFLPVREEACISVRLCGACSGRKAVFSFRGGWLDAMKEKEGELLERHGRLCQGEYLIIRHRKGLTFTDSFPLCALFCSPFMRAESFLDCLFAAPNQMSILVPDCHVDRGSGLVKGQAALCECVCKHMFDFFFFRSICRGLFARLFQSLCAAMWMCRR